MSSAEGADASGEESLGAGDSSSTDESETSETGEGETGGDPSQCHGGEPLGLSMGWLEPTVRDTEFWDGQTTHVLTCVVPDPVDPEDPITLACEGDGATLELLWDLPPAHGLLDASWAGRSLDVIARGDYDWFGLQLRGWFVIRDEQQALVWISATVALPEAEWTDPISIEVLDLGHDCVLNDDPCYPEYANVVLFSSPLDGELRAYDGGGHQTEHFTYLARSTTFEDLYVPFASDCRQIFDKYVGRWDEVRVVRRP